MIRCPSCGQRTLDVASVCPKCGHVLLQNPLEANAWSDLVSCRRCGKHIDRKAVVCPFCGHHRERARRLIATTWVVVILAVAGAAGYGAYRAGYLDWLLPERGPAVAIAPHTEPVALDTIPPSAAPIVAEPADTTPAQAVAAPPAQPSPTGRSEERGGQVPRLRARWTADWANVREQRSIDSPVVRVLAPGVQVDVAELQNGWWEYYERGARRGYIANSVLASQPPGLSS